MNGSPTQHSVVSASSQQIIELPAHKALKVYEIAKQFYTLGKGTSIELERVIKELSLASSYAPKDARHFFFLAKVFKQSLDFASAIYALRYVLRIDPNHVAAKKHLAELLMKHGQEKMSEAVLAQQRGLPMKHFELLYNTARVFFDECLLIQKSNPKCWMFKAVCHVNLGEANDATEAVSRGIHLLSIDVRVYVPWTDKRFENDSKNMTPKQISNLSLQRDKDKERHDRNVRILCEMHVLRGKLYWAAGLTDQGNKDLRLASTLQPEHPEVLAFGASSFRKAEKMYNQAVECFKEGNVAEALKLTNMALEISPEDIKLHIMLSKLTRSQRDLPAAFSAIQRATDLFSKSSQFDMKVPDDIIQQTNLVFNDMALQCAGLGEYEKSIALLNKVIASEKKLARGLTDVNFRFYVNRGDCHRARHELEMAASDYLLALRQASAAASYDDSWNIKTRLSLTYYLLATDFFNESSFDSADAALTLAIENNPKVASYFATRGTCRFYMGAYQEAYDDYKRCLALDPYNEDVRMKLKQQFEKARSSTDDDTGSAAGAPVAPKREVVSSGGFIDTKRQVVETMSKLKVSTGDLVDMMLNPRRTQNLPDIHKMVKSASNAALHAHTAAITSTPQPLPIVNPKLTTAFLAAQDVSMANSKMNTILLSKYDTKRGPMWSTLDNAKKMAMARCKPSSQPETDAEKTLRKTGKEKSYTSAGLKRYSQELSRAALAKYANDETFISGVITSWDDPFLNSADDRKGAKKLIISVSSKGIERKKYVPAEDSGSCDFIETEDSSLSNMLDAERALWKKLRAQGDGASVTDELIEHLTQPPPSRPPSGPIEGESPSLEGLGYATNPTERKDPPRLKPQSSFSRESYGANRKTANKFSSRGGNRLGLRVNFTETCDSAVSVSSDAAAEDGGGKGGDSPDDFFRGSVGVSRFAQMLSEHEGIDQHLESSGFGVISHNEESALLALTEEEELKVAAEMRAKAEREEGRRKRDLRREELRKKIMGEIEDLQL